MGINRQSLLILACIMATGLIIRWGAISFLCGPPANTYPTMDEMNFRELAVNILDYHKFATWTEGFYTVSTRAPIYPVLIATGYSLSGERSLSVPKKVNLFFDMCNILLMFFLARALFNSKIGLVGAGVYAVFGHASYFMAISSPHTFAVTLFLLVAISLVCIKRSYWLTVPALSIIYALLIHTRPVFLVALPFLFPAIWIQLSNKHSEKSDDEKETESIFSKKYWIWLEWKRKSIRSLIPVVLVLLLCLPWGIRNYREHKIIVPVSIVAGWHIASNINYDLKLSIKYLTDQLYAPERSDFKEADYFIAAKGKLGEAVFANPFKFFFYGLARVVYCWSPKGGLYRFVLPQAYIFPVYVFDGILLPLPDFEGFIYLFAAITLLAFFFLKKKLFQSFSYVLYRMRGILLIVIGYALVHIIGIPLIAYRFLVEPFCLIIFLALIFHYASAVMTKVQNGSDKQNPQRAKSVKMEGYACCVRSFAEFANAALAFCNIGKNKSEIEMKRLVRTNLIVAYFAIFILLIALSIPFCSTPNPQQYIYFALLRSHKVLDYHELRKMQWNNLGNIDPGTRVIVQGAVKYVHQGFKFVADDYYAVKDSEYTAARLYIRYGNEKNPLGIGDVRLNIKASDIPQDGDNIKVIGEAKTGPFKEIIIDVERWFD